MLIVVTHVSDKFTEHKRFTTRDTIQVAIVATIKILDCGCRRRRLLPGYCNEAGLVPGFNCLNQTSRGGGRVWSRNRRMNAEMVRGCIASLKANVNTEFVPNNCLRGS